MAQSHNHLEVTPEDILSAIGGQASKIVAGINQWYTGVIEFPDPSAIQEIINRMNQLNATLLANPPIQPDKITGNSNMNVQLS